MRRVLFGCFHPPETKELFLENMRVKVLKLRKMSSNNDIQILCQCVYNELSPIKCIKEDEFVTNYVLDALLIDVMATRGHILYSIGNDLKSKGIINGLISECDDET